VAQFVLGKERLTSSGLADSRFPAPPAGGFKSPTASTRSTDGSLPEETLGSSPWGQPKLEQQRPSGMVGPDGHVPTWGGDQMRKAFAASDYPAEPSTSSTATSSHSRMEAMEREFMESRRQLQQGFTADTGGLMHPGALVSAQGQAAPPRDPFRRIGELPEREETNQGSGRGQPQDRQQQYSGQPVDYGGGDLQSFSARQLQGGWANASAGPPKFANSVRRLEGMQSCVPEHGSLSERRFNGTPAVQSAEGGGGDLVAHHRQLGQCVGIRNCCTNGAKLTDIVIHSACSVLCKGLSQPEPAPDRDKTLYRQDRDGQYRDAEDRGVQKEQLTARGASATPRPEQQR